MIILGTYFAKTINLILELMIILGTYFAKIINLILERMNKFSIKIFFRD